MAEPIQPVATSTKVIAPVPHAPLAPRKRHPVRTLIIVVVILAVVVVAFVVADGFAKRYATGYVKDSIISALHLDPKTPVQVDLGGGSIILQAITGGIREVTVHIPSLTFGDLSGSADIVATNVPLDSSKPLDKLGIVMTISQDDVRKLAGFLSGLDLKKIEVGNGVIRIGTDLSVLFFTLPVGVDLVPSAHDGGISFEPKTVVLGTNTISVADLRSNPTFAGLAGTLLASRQVCVASYLPKALTVDDVRVSGSNLVVTIDGNGAALGGPALSTLGTCPGQ